MDTLPPSPQTLGQHNEAVYCRLLGYSPQELDRWKALEVI